MKITSLVFKALIGTVIFAGFLTVSSEMSRSQSEKPEIRPAWNPGKEILIATAVPVSGQSLQLEIPKFVAKEIKETRETQEVIKEEEKDKIEVHVSVVNEPVIDSIAKPVSVENISAQALTPQIPKVTAPAIAREEKAEGRTSMPITMTGQVTLPKLSPPALLTHKELQAMVNYLDYEIFPGRGVRFQYSDLSDDHMGHMWFLKRPRDLRGKTVRIDYRGYVPVEMTFKIARSGTSASVTRKVKLESSPYGSKSVFLEIPDKFPFKDVKYFEFWIDRESAGRMHGDFIIEKVVVLEKKDEARQAPNEARPESFPFNRPFVPTNLIRSEVPLS
jgi:hypothetical protein